MAWPLASWLGGRSVATAGVAAVAAVPERRGGGVTSALMRALLLRAREGGTPYSALYPSRAAFYRRLGYEYAGSYVQSRVSLSELPHAEEERVEEHDPARLAALQDCYRAFAATQSGLVDSDEAVDWWENRVMRRWNPEVNSRVAVVPGDRGVEGYAAFTLEAMPETWGYRLVCSHLIATTPRALASLLSYFRGFRGIGQQLAWYGAPNDPVGLLVGGGAEAIQQGRVLRFMVRILDVPRALEARGCSQIGGEATIEVKDDLIPENRGPWRIEAHEGAVRVAPARGTAPTGPPVPIGALSALFGGHASPRELRVAGLLAGDDPALDFLARLCAGPQAWMTDFF